MAQTTLNPTYNAELEMLSELTWTAARDVEASENIDTTSVQLEVRSETGFHCARMFMTFDLSAIPSNATIDSATLRIQVTGSTAGDAAHGELNVVSGTPADATSYAEADYDQFGTTSFGTVDASSTGTKTFTINASGLTYLEGKFGTNAVLVLRTKKDFDDTEPTDTGNMTVGSKDNSTEAYRPLLTVNYTDIENAVFMGTNF